MTLHPEEHPLAGEVVELAGEPVRIYDWFDRCYGDCWLSKAGGLAALDYALRCGARGLPIDNEVLLARMGDRGLLIHASELAGCSTS